VSDLSTWLLPLLTAVIGFGLSQFGYVRSRKDRLRDALLEQRGAAYRAFMKDVHLTTHLIGRATKGCPQPLDDSIEAFAAVDRDVARGLYELEVLAGEKALDAARDVRGAVRMLRETVQQGAEYKDEKYLEALHIYRGARERFLHEARKELLGVSHRA
jgi:hypothetical protein